MVKDYELIYMTNLYVRRISDIQWKDITFKTCITHQITNFYVRWTYIYDELICKTYF